ncbi:MAG TPA: hypothetical protein VK918_06200 [Pyrinomonadaceae bacterium]|nr:hypothetical protein [Pyrinomonadaceae bacterium]
MANNQDQNDFTSNVKDLASAARNTAENAAGSAASSAENIAGGAAGTAATMKRSVAESLSNAGEKLHTGADSTTSYLETGAEKVHDIALSSIEKANKVGHRAADAISGASEYIRDADLRKAGQDIRETVVRKPEISLAIAGLFGLVLGLLLGRRSSDDR